MSEKTHQGMINRLRYCEQYLAEMVVDEQDKAEASGYFTRGMFTGTDHSTPICVPEDAAPDLDAARTHIQEAIEDIENHIKGATT